MFAVLFMFVLYTITQLPSATSEPSYRRAATESASLRPRPRRHDWALVLHGSGLVYRQFLFGRAGSFGIMGSFQVSLILDCC